MKSRVLIFNNDPTFCAEIQNALSEATMIADIAISSSEAIDLFLHYKYSLLLVGIDTEGKEIIRPLRAITFIPILALCEQNNSEERTAILMAGASACLTKPIDLQKCVAQAKALLNLYYATSEKIPSARLLVAKIL